MVDQGAILVGERVTNLTFNYNLVESYQRNFQLKCS